MRRSSSSGHSLHDYHVVYIPESISSIDYDAFSINRNDWLEIVNAGDALSRFESFEFNDGSTRYWVEDRIEELFGGLYADILNNRPNQVKMIVD